MRGASPISEWALRLYSYSTQACRRLVEEGEREIGQVFQHGDQPALDRTPERLLGSQLSSRSQQCGAHRRATASATRARRVSASTRKRRCPAPNLHARWIGMEGRKDGHPGRRTVTYKATRDERPGFRVASERRNDAVLAEGVDDADGKRPGLEMRVQIASGRERPEPRNIQALRIRLAIEEGLLDRRRSNPSSASSCNRIPPEAPDRPNCRHGRPW